MALRVAHRLIRLWLVLSVLWVAGVAFMAWWFDGIAASEPPATGSLTLCPDDPSSVFGKYVTGCVKPGEYLAARAAGRRSGQEGRCGTPLKRQSPGVPATDLRVGLAWVFRGLR